MSPTRPNEDEAAGDERPFVDNDADELLGNAARDPEEDDEGEDLFGDRMEDDYRIMPELDRYDPEEVDQDDFSEMDIEDRVAAERAMKMRDKREGRSATKGKIKGLTL